MIKIQQVRKFGILGISLLLACSLTRAQSGNSFKVNGNGSTFYPVLFTDPGWPNNVPTVLQIGRSNVHMDTTSNGWRGSLTATFTYHLNFWGNLANFIDAQIEQNPVGSFGGASPFVAGWVDPTTDNASIYFIVWLRGGSTYFYHSNYPILYYVVDGIANPLPYTTPNTSGGAVHSYNAKTSVDSYVNNAGLSYGESIVSTSNNPNYFNGAVGIGTSNVSGYSLAVNGNVRAKSIKVESGWSDFVFMPNYHLLDLKRLKSYIQKNKHLPEIETEKEVKRNGVDLAESNRKLLQKVEELTLYIIKLNERLDTQDSILTKMKTNK